MKFLEELNFKSEELDSLENNVPNILQERLTENKKLVSNNINYLKKIGIKNYKEIFFKFYDMFLLDYSVFTEIFEKYEKEDLVNKLKNNIDIIEYL